jgi:hypothetical protein
MNRIKDKNHMIISIDAGKLLAKLTFLHAEIPQHTRNTRNIPQHYKSNNDKPITNIILNREKLILFPLKSGMK